MNDKTTPANQKPIKTPEEMTERELLDQLWKDVNLLGQLVPELSNWQQHVAHKLTSVTHRMLQIEKDLTDIKQDIKKLKRDSHTPVDIEKVVNELITKRMH